MTDQGHHQNLRQDDQRLQSSSPNRNAAGFAAPHGLYDPAFEHDSCGVGFVAALDAMPRKDLAKDAIRILVNLEHRGAVGGDKATGDGAGVLVDMPDEFLRRECGGLGLSLPKRGDYGVAMVFLPTDQRLAESCVATLEKTAAMEGMRCVGWRGVPTDSRGLGDFAKSAMPVFRQFFVERSSVDAEAFERKLYVVRNSVEKEVGGWKNVDASQFYVASFSSRILVYKGMLTGTQMARFYPDLMGQDFSIAFAIVHQRYSTNTLPTWKLAQPFRMLAHNGEINTLRGNINRFRARECQMKSDLLGGDLRKVSPVMALDGSDSAILDNALELLVHGGRSLPHSMMMMVPEAWGARYHMSADKRAFYEYHSAVMEPWDGPAALVFTDGRYIGATLDRNGLRPARYTVTKDGLIVLASETGVLDIPPCKLQYRGQLKPGKMLLIDLKERRIVPDREIKAKISRRRPYRTWLKDNRIELRGLGAPSEAPSEPAESLRVRQLAFGYTEEDLKMIITPMAARGQEPVGSMGNDAALAALSNRPQLLFDYFKQLFAQVTNPPIDPLREELVMSLMSYIGRERNLLDETPAHCRMLKLNHPILTPEDITRLRCARHPDLAHVDLPMVFPRSGAGELKRSLDGMFAQAQEAIAKGASLLILTDRGMDTERVPVPPLLAASGLHHHLIRQGLRTNAAIIVESGEVREVIHFAMLIAFGVNAICPYEALSTVRSLADEELLDPSTTPEGAVDNYISAVKKGLLKTLSRMGISTIRSFLGSQIFEALGIAREVVDTYFTGAASRIGGVGLEEIAAEARMRHAAAFPDKGKPSTLLGVGGFYQYRDGGEAHMWTPQAIHCLQQAVRRRDSGFFKQYRDAINDQSRQRLTIRSLFRFKPGSPVPVDEVEPVESIVRRFVVSAMSFGSISKEAHETIAAAANRLGMRSNSGEGGEDPARGQIGADGENRMSKVRQVASGRFGVTTDYLLRAEELQIKVAQGAKPGEGGQLPGHKVTQDIARVRHTTPGVTLISPPPHHDIYSIEDLAQLIYDLKCANQKARVSVKLVSEVGVGTIAAGVAKARADMVLIAGYDGGTGASPLTAIKYAGLPWELGLAETQLCLRQNGLRDKIRIQVDGQLRTGRDIAIAALLGAEEFGFATSVLVSMGCVMMRKCHSNTCPVGVATQDPQLRARFAGKIENVVNFFQFLAQDLREVMAELGFRTVEDMVGHSERLEFQRADTHWKTKGLDLSAVLLPPAAVAGAPLRCLRKEFAERVACFDDELIREAAPALERKERVRIVRTVRNVDRTIGARLSSEVVRRHGAAGLPSDTISVELTGSAGQSLGAFLAAGVTITVRGDVNDFLGKGLSGGRIVVAPHPEAGIVPHESVIAGNVTLYGATAGEVFLNGMAGERFAVRNSGVNAVVEGVGDHGCEYMTGGIVVVLGPTGDNFAAGMSGGIAYVYDETGLFDTRCNLDMVDLESVWTASDQSSLKALLRKHLELTGSGRAKLILDNWEARLPYFVKVLPVEYRKVLERMQQKESRESETVSATEEVYGH